MISKVKSAFTKIFTYTQHHIGTVINSLFRRLSLYAPREVPINGSGESLYGVGFNR